MSTIKFKKKFVFSIIEGLENSKTIDKKPVPTFKISLARIKKNFKTIKEELEEGKKPSKEYEQYIKERMELLEKYSLKEDGKTVYEKQHNPNIPKMPKLDPDKAVGFKRALKNLEKKNKEVIDEFEKQREMWEELLDEEMEYKGIPFIKSDLHPKMTVGDVITIWPIYRDFKEEDYRKGTIKLKTDQIIGGQARMSILNNIYGSLYSAVGKTLAIKMAYNYYEIESLLESLKKDKRYTFLEKVFEKEKKKVVDKYSEKDPFGDPKIMYPDGGRPVYDIPDESQDDFNKAMMELRDKYEKDFEAYEKFLDEEHEIPVCKLTMADIEEGFKNEDEKDDSNKYKVDMTQEAADTMLLFLEEENE